MGEWVPKEEWEQQQRGNKQQIKPPFRVPLDLLPTINKDIQKDEMEQFLTCLCSGIKNLYSISDGLVKLRCRGCGMEYGYPDDHQYFNIKKPKPESVQQIQAPKTPTLTKEPICTCRKCQSEISKEQAKSSLDFVGQELCEACMGAELE